jgi:NO-binding membrane sensor protein with MHYT domain
VASLAVSIVVVGLGVFAVASGRSRTLSLAAGGLIMGVGVAAMHYLGMSAMHVTGTVVYDGRTVALSVLIAVVAATAALWAALTVSSPPAAAGASLIMGVAVAAMHYTGMAAAHVRVDAGGPTPAGTSGTDFIVPMTVMLGSYLFLTSAFVALSSTAQERSAAEAAELLRNSTLTAAAPRSPRRLPDRRLPADPSRNL